MRSSLALLLIGCSAGGPTFTPCASSEACRDGFGFGYTCGEAGYCEALEVPDRCTSSYPTDLLTRPEDHPDVLVLGTLFDHDSDLANLQSVELAVDEAGLEGGLDGRELAVVHCDYQVLADYDNATAGEAAAEAIRWFAEDVGAPAIVGPAASQVVLESFDVAETTGTLLISPSATSDLLVGIDGEVSTEEAPGLFWRTAPADADQAAAISADLLARGVQAGVVVVAQDGAYGNGLSTALQASLGLAADRVFTYANNNQLTLAISDASEVDGLEEVVFISSDASEIASFLNGAAVLPAYDGVGFFLTDTARNAEVLQGASGASALFDRVHGSAPIADPATADVQATFNVSYSARYGDQATEDSYNAFAYDAAWLALYGAAWAHHQETRLDGLSIARGLRQVSSGDPVRVRLDSWSTVQERFAAGQSIDVRGASGELDFDPTTGETSNPIAVWAVNAAGTGFVDEKLCYGASCTDFPTD